MLQRLAVSSVRGVVLLQRGSHSQGCQLLQQQKRGFAQLDFVDRDMGVTDTKLREFVAEKRTVAGTRHCDELRKQGLVPGIVYGKDASGKDRRLLIQIPQQQFQKELNDVGRSFEGILYNVLVDNELFRVLPRDLSKHPYREEIVSANFLIHDPNRKARVKIPLEFYNLEKCTGLRQGGTVSHALTIPIEETASLQYCLMLMCDCCVDFFVVRSFGNRAS